MSAPLTGVAFLTGATGGIGSATAVAYAKAGVAALYLTDLEIALPKLQELAEKCRSVATDPNFSVATAVLDVSIEADVDRVVSEAAQRFGRIDYAANIAGISETMPCGIADCTTEAFDGVMNVNVRGLFFCLRAEVRIMRTQDPRQVVPGRPGERGSIINMASIASETVIAPLPAYGTSKHAIVGLTRYAAASHASDGIRINALSPGFIDTTLVRRFPEHVVALLADATAQKRLGTAEEVGDLFVFLSGPGASFVTGQSWKADGGLLNLKVQSC